jgi:hypothetical protein
MGRKDKGRLYAAQAGYGAEISRQPAPGKGDYGYKLKCDNCGWTSKERPGQINLKKSSELVMGRFDCESCNASVPFAIQELRE